MHPRTQRIALALPLLAGVAMPIRTAAAERGSAEATLLGKRIVIEYGRPVLGGRSLDALLAKLGDDRVWRAGADDITTLTTGVDLSLDTLCGSSCSKLRKPGRIRRLPAGKYSVYVSAPLEGDWALVLNIDAGIELGALGKRLGFSVPEGSEKRLWPHLEGYNANFPERIPGIAGTEAARVLMRSGSANPPIDLFTMHLEAAGSDAVTLTMAWGDRTWAVDLKADSRITPVD
jgi:hypothetical protein